MPSLSGLLRAAGAIVTPLACTGAFAITVEVGPDGRYATIQAGIDAVVSAGGGDVLVESAYYPENPVLDIDDIAVGVHGGYDAGFQPAGLPTLVALGDGNGDSWRVLTRGAHGHAFVGGFSLYGAAGHPGAYLQARDASYLSFQYNQVSDNHHDAVTQDYVYGGGIEAEAHDSAWVELVADEVRDNSVSARDYAFGGGVSLHAFDAGRITAEQLDVHDNALTYAGQACYGAGLAALAGQYGAADVDLTDLTISGNGESCGSQAVGHAGGLYAASADLAAPHGVHTNRIRIVGNTVSGSSGSSESVYLEARGGAIDFSDALVVGGNDRGLYASDYRAPHFFVENVTVARNGGAGLRLDGDVQLTNTLSAQNGQPDQVQENWLVLRSLLGLTDARFVDAAAGDYHLRADSPAIDAGTNFTPHGLQTADLDGHPRPYDGGVADGGCYESSYVRDRIFANGFETSP
ncbi:choice-of-anchor Q domain-containing protein [Dokdonella sp.]|uniref:choice-of-anchor Q domain-containing protein n=1 Tax=Dokdonella sp. TaxID=2291710 RepID=UPI001B152F22|nr:choice-of-anchor Q domain-containing protein [Dokdonella sp.]MBO9662459.1 hypothetical protein [Dokdonella sp.]